MTQSPQSGEAAPMSTTGLSAPSTGDEVSQHDSADSTSGSAGPSPSTPSSSTPWGSTSTASGAPSWTGTPIGSADSPTASVPLIQEGARSGDGGSAATSSARQARPRGPRRARLQLRHINPWTVLKFSCVLSIALFFVWLIVIGVLFGVLDGAGVINKINDAYTTIQGGDAQPPVTAGVVFGGAAIIGVVNIVLFIALSTVGAVVYNLCADLVGGIEITLSER
jgi:Transmembrane domain of unknown function (DUF3566)